jgi:hypothetical protein
MALDQYRNFNRQAVFPSTWPDAIEQVLSNYVSPNFMVEKASATTVRVVAATGPDARIIMIRGKPRWVETTVTATHPGGTAGNYDIWAITTADSFGTTAGPPSGETDTTNHAFALKVGGTPSGSGSEAHGTKIGVAVWDGTKIIDVIPLVGKPRQLEIPTVDAMPASPVHGQECYYQNAAMKTQGKRWHFFYNSLSADTYKWEFIGGQSLSDIWDSDGLRSVAATYGDCADGSHPTLTVPLTGDYSYRMDAMSFRTGGTGGFNPAGIGLSIGNAQPTGVNYSQQYSQDGQIGQHHGESEIELGTGQVISVIYVAAFNQTTFRARRLHLEPIRVA